MTTILTQTLAFIFSQGKEVTILFFVLLIVSIIGVYLLATGIFDKFISKGSWSWGSFKWDGSDRRKSHDTCPRVGDIYLIIETTGRYTRKILELSTSISTLREQKAFCRSTANKVIKHAELKLVDILEKQGVREISLSKEYTAFVRFGEDVKRTGLDLFFEACEENHFAEKTEREFEDYLSARVDTIIEEIRSYSFRVMPEIIFTLPEYKESMKDIYEELIDGLVESFRYARDLAQKRVLEADIVEKNFHVDIKKIITGEYRNELSV